MPDHSTQPASVLLDGPIITAALTGPIATKADNGALPTTPEEIAIEAAAACDAGAAVVHVHLRDEAGAPTADLDRARSTIAAIRARCSAIIQLSTGVSPVTSFEERERLVEVRPEMATLNVCSMTFGEGEFRNPPDGVRRLAARMLELGVRPEIEIYDTGHIDMALRLCDEGLVASPMQFSIVLGVSGGAPATPESLVSMVRRLPAGAAWQVIGLGRNNLPLTTMGLAMGGNARTGMEDTLLLRRGVPADGNRPLVERLVRVARSIEREPASIASVRAAFGLPDIEASPAKHPQ